MKSSARTSSPAKLAIVAAAALLATAPAALADEKLEYAEKVEPICKANSEANPWAPTGLITRNAGNTTAEWHLCRSMMGTSAIN